MGQAKQKRILGIPKVKEVAVTGDQLAAIKNNLNPQKYENVNDIISDFLKKVNNPQPVKPLISIVTIYDEANEKEWLDGFIDNLPVVENGLIELILCKCIQGEPDEIKTPAIHKNGVKIYYMRCFYDTWNFAEARNAARKSATGEWIISLDTDELLLQHQIGGIMRALKSAPDTLGAIALTVFSHVFDPVSKGMQYLPKTAYRIFRNVPEIYFQSKAHECIDFTLKESGYDAVPSTFMIYHLGYEKRDANNMRQKLQRNYDLLVDERRNTSNPKIKEYAAKFAYDTEKILKQIN